MTMPFYPIPSVQHLANDIIPGYNSQDLLNSTRSEKDQDFEIHLPKIKDSLNSGTSFAKKSSVHKIGNQSMSVKSGPSLAYLNHQSS